MKAVNRPSVILNYGFYREVSFMKNTRIITAAMAAVLALTPAAGYTLRSSTDIPAVAAAAETGATVTYKGRSYTYSEEKGIEYVICDGMYFRMAGDRAVITASEEVSGDVVIPEEVPLASELKNAAGTAEYSGKTVKVTEIGEWAFKYQEQITSVTIPDSIGIIRDQAFDSCSSLSKINAPERYIALGRMTFFGTPWYIDQIDSDKEVIFCGNLLSVPDVEEYTVPEGVKTVYDAGGVMNNLTRLTIPEGVEYIIDSFGYCEKLSEVVLPLSIKEIDRSFGACPSLEGMHVAATAEEWMKTGRYIANNVCMFDKDGRMFFVPKEKPTGISEPYSEIRGEVKTELKVGESVEFSVFGRGFMPGLAVMHEDGWFRDEYAMKLELLGRECDMGDTLNITEKYRLTAIAPGTFRFMPGLTSPWDSFAPQLVFKVAEGEAPAAVLSEKTGDANEDGKINVADAVAVLQFIANKSKYPLTETGIANADIDGTEGITGGDAAAIQRLDAGLPLTK